MLGDPVWIGAGVAVAIGVGVTFVLTLTQQPLAFPTAPVSAS